MLGPPLIEYAAGEEKVIVAVVCNWGLAGLRTVGGAMTAVPVFVVAAAERTGDAAAILVGSVITTLRPAVAEAVGWILK